MMTAGSTKAELMKFFNQECSKTKRLEREVSSLEVTRDGQRANIGKLQEEVKLIHTEIEDLANTNGALENNVEASKNAINSMNAEIELLESDNVKFKAMLQMLVGGKYLKKSDVEAAADFLRFIDWY